MDNKELIKVIKENIVKVLIANKFVVQVYEAYNTNSVYIKLDYGVCNSIRISDHLGKEKLCYRYNIILNEPDNIVEEKYMRYFYSQSTWDKLIQQIIFDRMQKQHKYKKSYEYFMLKNKREHQKDKQGFWRQAVTLNDDRTEDDWNDIERRYRVSHGAFS